MEEEVAAVEDDEVDHRGPVKMGGVLWVVSHRLQSPFGLLISQSTKESVWILLSFG